MFQLKLGRRWWTVLRILHILIVLGTFSFSIAESYLTCSDWNERSIDFAVPNEPIIGFIETVMVNGVLYAGWYIVEESSTQLLPFKAFKAWFELNTYVDGLEIGERFETPREQWPTKGFIDYNSMEEAFWDLLKYAPVCVVKSWAITEPARQTQVVWRFIFLSTA